jgi:hypothetical protein
MARYHQVCCLGEQPSDNDNRITVTWTGPDQVQRTYTVNQRALKRYTTAEEAKAALDDWTQKNFGYVLNDVWLHKNRDGITWALATGASPPEVWPEDMVEE